MGRFVLMTVILCGVVSLAAAGVCAPSAWYIQALDAATHASGETSLALDANGYPHISFFDVNPEALKYAVWNGSSWNIQTVTTSSSPSTYTSLALDANGDAHISYYASYGLSYAAWNGSSWDIQDVDGGGDVGRYCSLALDANGDPHISYYDATNHDLKYAAWNRSRWTVETVDSEGWVGKYTSISLDANDYPRVSYHDWTNQDLKYAARGMHTWTIQTVDRIGAVGESTSLALAGTGYPRISYYARPPLYDLKYAAWNGTRWNIQTVDSQGMVGDLTSLALDASGYPHISYRDYTNGALKYAVWNGSWWDIETVDSAGSVGLWSSLVIDADGFAHISYLVGGPATDVKYATARPPAAASHELPAAGYYMISFPLTPSSATVHDVLCDDLGDGNYYMWRWHGGGYAVVPTSLPQCQYATTSTQRAYWLLSAAATLDIDVGGTLAGGDQVIPLQTGWNMVAAPYEATLDSLQVDNGGDVRSLADAEAAGWVLATFYYSHDGTGSYSTVTIGQTPADTLALWHGYWVLAALDCSLVVPEPTGGGATARRVAERAPAGLAWTLDVRARCGSFVDRITIAAADAASDDFDGFALDKPKPPPSPDEGRLRIALKSDAETNGPLRAIADLAMETKRTGQEAPEWQFSVSGGVKGNPVMLSWPNVSRLPRDRRAILTDRDTGHRTFMRTRADYQFGAPGDGSSRNFTVTLGPAHQGALLITSLSAAPLRGSRGAELRFSLSADATVHISILNVAGRLVERARESLAVEAGGHTVTWVGRSMSGTALPNGLYLCVLSARAPDGEQARRVCAIALRR